MTTLARYGRTGRRPLLFAAEAPTLPWVRLGGMAAVGIGALLALVLVRVTGGSPNQLNHLGYGPIILAAYLFGWRGALATAAYVGILLGPVPAATGMAGGVEQPNAWAIRGVMLIAVGVLTGALFDRSRAALRGVQLAGRGTIGTGVGGGHVPQHRSFRVPAVGREHRPRVTPPSLPRRHRNEQTADARYRD